MTQQELAILVDLLNRTPMTPAERAWVQALIGKLRAEIENAAKQGA